jgi:hypothetical protein
MICFSKRTELSVTVRRIFLRPRQWGDCFVHGWQDYADYIDADNARSALAFNLTLFQRGLISRDLALQVLLGSA